MVSTEPVVTGTPRGRAYRQIAEGLELQAQGYRLLAVAEPETRTFPRPAADKGKLLNAVEVQQRLRRGKTFVWSLAKRGTLPGVKVGKRLCFHEADVEAYLRRCERAARS